MAGYQQGGAGRRRGRLPPAVRALRLRPAPRVRPHPHGPPVRRPHAGRHPPPHRRRRPPRAHPRRAAAGAAHRARRARGHPRHRGRALRRARARRRGAALRGARSRRPVPRDADAGEPLPAASSISSPPSRWTAGRVLRALLASRIGPGRRHPDRGAVRAGQRGGGRAVRAHRRRSRCSRWSRSSSSSAPAPRRRRWRPASRAQGSTWTR